MKILLALIKKEIKQILRDPSSIIIAFVLPFISIMIYMYGINLDSVKITMGIKNDDNNAEVNTLVKSFGHSKYIKSIIFDNQKDIETAILRSKIKGSVIIPNDFSTKLSRGQKADLLVITDGSEVNTANYVQNYTLSIANQWLKTSKYKSNMKQPLISTEVRTWYNPDLNSHYFIVPGSIAITMTLIGILLTSLVVAREWERGTMEALLSTNVKPIQIVLCKYIPYFILGMLSVAFNVFLCTVVFKIPFRGNYFILFTVMIRSKLMENLTSSFVVSIRFNKVPLWMISASSLDTYSPILQLEILIGIVPP